MTATPTPKYVYLKGDDDKYTLRNIDKATYIKVDKHSKCIKFTYGVLHSGIADTICQSDNPTGYQELMEAIQQRTLCRQKKP